MKKNRLLPAITAIEIRLTACFLIGFFFSGCEKPVQPEKEKFSPPPGTRRVIRSFPKRGSVAFGWAAKNDTGAEVLEGEWIEKDVDSKTIRVKGHYRAGKKHGTWTYFSAEGKKIKEIEWKNARPHGRAVEWYPSGRKKSVSHSKNGKWHGKWTRWYPSGRIKSIREYDLGKIHGTSTAWYKNGQKKFEAEFKQGKRHGSYVKYKQDGTTILKSTYKNGKLHGPFYNYRASEKNRLLWYEDGIEVKTPADTGAWLDKHSQG